MARAIEVETLGKYYPIGSRGEGYVTLRESLSSIRRRRSRRNRDEGIWALRDVDLTVEEGEVVGVIGPNGAGKTTLLKILTRITEPTTGVTRTRGRVGALLEVGTGFHPELTGRENVYLNGAILGMRQREIRRKFDEIVEFSEIEPFIDTPVKHYSSGMHMRLAFAVAAHLEPEVLIVDEVLAVGDVAFQRKSLGKMDQVASQGRTVVFVSHNMTAVESLCDRVIWVDQGGIRQDGAGTDVVAAYLGSATAAATLRSWDTSTDAPGNEWVRLRKASVMPAAGPVSDPITVRTPIAIEFEYENLRPATRLNLSLHLYTGDGILLLNAVPVRERTWFGKPLPAGIFRDRCCIPKNLLNNGTYRVELLVVKDQSVVVYEDRSILEFDVRDIVEAKGVFEGEWSGVIRPPIEWETELLEARRRA